MICSIRFVRRRCSRCFAVVFAGAWLAQAPCAGGAIMHRDFGGHDTQGFGFALDITENGVVDFRVLRGQDRIFVSGQVEGNGVLRDPAGGSFAMRMTVGEEIGPGSVFQQIRDLAVLVCDGAGGPCAWFGPWPQTQQPEIMGLAFQLNNATHYAWLSVSVSRLGGTIRIWELAWESEPMTPILAGAVPAPGAAGLLALGALAAARRRARLEQ